MPQQEQELHGIICPHENDVLSGRGNFVNYHVGNENFRSLVRKHKIAYVACPKQQKGRFSKMIVDEVRSLNPPGRFLKQDQITKLWYDIGERKAMDKTRQALREGAPDIMKELQPGDKESDDNDDSDSQSPLSRKSCEQTSSSRPAPPNRQLPVRSVSCQPQLPGFSSNTHNYPTQSSQDPYSSSPAMAQRNNLVHGDSRLQPILSQQVPQRTSSFHLSTAGNVAMAGSLATMQMIVNPSQTMSRNLQSPPQHNRLSLSQHLDQAYQPSPQHHQMQQQVRERQLLQQQRQLQQHQIQLQQQQQSLSQHLLTTLQQQSNQFNIVQQQHFQQVPQNSHALLPVSNSAISSIPIPVNHQSSPLPEYQQSPLASYQSEAPSVNDSHRGDFRHASIVQTPVVQQAPLSLPSFLDDSTRKESERLAPLPSRDELALKLSRVNKLNREESEKSIQVDNIFPRSVMTKKTDGAGADYKMHPSSSHLSIMSLSMGDMGLGDDIPIENPSEPACLADEKDLSTRFNNSLRLGRHSSGNSAAAQRNTSNDASHSAFMNMSVATLGGDRFTDEFGDMSVVRMTESQANMSFSNVFEETDNDVLADPNGRN